MDDLDVESRFAVLERRLERIERALATAENERAAAQPVRSAQPDRLEPVSSAPPVLPRTPVGPARAGSSVRAPRPSSVERAPQILGIGGAVALVLAASYLVRLAIDSGWLTPLRQVSIAALAGIGLVVGGILLRGGGKRYASILSAGGIVVLFLTVYGAHLYHGLIGAPLATAAVAGLCFVALWLGRLFESTVYVMFAVVGAYSTPFLVRTDTTDVTRLVLYYTSWSALFCAYSIWLGGRSAYLIASFLAVAGFDLAWRTSGGADWQIAVGYQAVQFLLFTATTAFYSARYRSPLTVAAAVAHVPSLLVFYTIEYGLLDAHLTEWAPWIALGSVGVVLLAYVLVRPRLSGAKAGAVLVSGYATLVLLHAGYIELVPWRYHPWIGLAVFVGVGTWRARGGVPDPVRIPLLVGASVVWVLNVLRLLVDAEMDEVPLASAVYVAYPVALYLAYAIGTALGVGRARAVLLYTAHLTAMVAAARLVDASVVVSVLWGAIAIGSLLVALRKGDRALGRSSFLVFGASAVKVMTFDLAGSDPLVRIGSLAVLGVTLYAGGWLYRRLGQDAEN